MAGYPFLRSAQPCVAPGIACSVLATSHSARRSRLVNSSSQVGSMRIGAPQMRIDLASPVEAGLAEAGRRSVSARVLCNCGRGRGTAIALTGAISEPTFLGASVCISSLLLGAYQHFSPMCPGIRSRHIACDPGCAAHTASALERHSAWAVDAVPIKTARTRGTRIIAPRYALLDHADQKNLIETGREEP